MKETTCEDTSPYTKQLEESLLNALAYAIKDGLDIARSLGFQAPFRIGRMKK